MDLENVAGVANVVEVTNDTEVANDASLNASDAEAIDG